MKRTTYSFSPGCVILVIAFLVLLGICVGIGYEFARWLLS